MENVKGRVPLKKVVSIIPNEGSRFCLVNGQTPEVNQKPTASTTRPRSSGSIRSISPAQRWPVRSKSQDRNFLRRSLIFEEGGSKVAPENGVTHIPKLPFTRPRGFSQSSGGDSGARENGTGTQRSASSPVRNEFSSRSSMSSRESSQESLDQSSSRGLSPSRGRSRQLRTTRKANSISQKAKIWEVADKTDTPKANFSTLPWSTKFARSPNFANGRPEERNPRLLKTCSSPSLTDMMEHREATNVDELMARDIVDYYNREIQPSEIPDSSGSKSKRKLKRASTSSIDGLSLRKRSLTPLDEEDHNHPAQCSRECSNEHDDVSLAPVIENSDNSPHCDPQLPPHSNVIAGIIGPSLTEVEEPGDASSFVALGSSPLEEKEPDMRGRHLEDDAKELTPVRLVMRQNAFDKNSSAKQELRFVSDPVERTWRQKVMEHPPPEINGVNHHAQMGRPVRAIFLTSNLEFDEEEPMGAKNSPAFPGESCTHESRHTPCYTSGHHSGFAKTNISPLAEENEEDRDQDEEERDQNEKPAVKDKKAQVSEKKSARSLSVGETQRPQIVAEDPRPEVTIKREAKVVVEFPDDKEQNDDVIQKETTRNQTSTNTENVLPSETKQKRVSVPKSVEIEEVPSDSEFTNEESLFSADITPKISRVQINDDEDEEEDLPPKNVSVPNFLVIQELESEGTSVVEEREKSPEKVKCDIRIEITLCDDPDNPVDPMLDEDCEAPTRSNTPEHFEVSEDDDEDENEDDDFDDDDDSIDFTASQTNILGKDDDDLLRDEDLELVTLSNPASSDESEDEFEALRLQRLKESGRREAPERDISEDDTETAEFQLRLRKLSNTSAPSLGGSNSLAYEGDIQRARSVEEVQFEEDEDFFEKLRGNRDLEQRTSEVPEREIEQEDSETAELQTTLRRSKSNEIFIRRKKSRGNLNPAKRNSLGLEILVEQAPKEESPPEEPLEPIPIAIAVPPSSSSPHSPALTENEEQPLCEVNESLIKEDEDSGRSRPPVNCLFKSLSAGSDLDKLREISKQKGCIQSLVNLSLLNHTNASNNVRAISPPPSQKRAISNASPITASILSINKLAESVENLKEKLVSHPGLFFPPPKSCGNMSTAHHPDRTGSSLSPPNGGPDPEESSSSHARPRKKTPLSRSHSWQGFGSKEVVRQIRQQAFYDSGRYEQVNASDLDLPPPPSAPPVNVDLERGRSSQVVSSMKRGGKSANSGKKAARRYRPLSHSPLRNPNGGAAGPRIAEEELESEPNRVPSSCSPEKGANNASSITSCSSSSSPSNSLGRRPGSITRNHGNKWKKNKGGTRDHNLKKSDTADREQWSASDEESDNENGLNYKCVVTCSLQSSEKVLSQQAEKNFIRFSQRMEELRCQIVQARPELSPEQVHHILATVTQLHDQKQRDLPEAGSGSPLPSDEELQDFLNYIGNGILNQDRLEYDERRKRELEGVEDNDEDLDQSVKRNKSANQYFYRQHYLSIIQEEEEAGDSPTSSRPNSRPPSACGLPKGNNLKKALKDLKDFSQSESIKEQKEHNANHLKTRAAKKHDSWGSEISEDSLISVNSILSDENNLPERESTQEALNEFLDQVPPPPPRFQNVELAPRGSPQLVRTSSSSSNSTMADSRCSSAFSSDLIKDLPHDDVPETVNDLSLPSTAKTMPNQSRRKPERQRIPPSSPSSMGNKSIFHLTSVKEKLRNVIHPGKDTTNEHQDPSPAKPSSPQDQPTTPTSTSKVGRFFRSLSRKSSTEDSETDDRKRNSLTSKEEDKSSRRGSSSSITEKTFEKVRMIATKKDFFTSGNNDAEVNHLSSSSDVPSVCCASDSCDSHQKQPPTNTQQLPRRPLTRPTTTATPLDPNHHHHHHHQSDRGNNALSHPSGVGGVPPIPNGLQKDVPQIKQFAGATSPKIKQCQEQQTLNLEDMYQKIDKTQKRAVTSKPATATDVSITDLISECEDYVKTEEFTKDLSVKILEMFQNERNKFQSDHQEQESVYNVISAKSEPIYSNVPQLVDHYSAVDQPAPPIGVPRLRLGSPHNNFCILEPHYSKPVDHQNIYEQIDQFSQAPIPPKKPDRLVPTQKSPLELEPKFPCTRESIYENEEASYHDLPSIITHEASPMDSLPSENSSSAHDSAYESENKPMKETQEPPKRPTYPSGSYYENLTDNSFARVPPVPVPPQFQDESPTTNQFELDDPSSTIKRNPHFTPPPQVPKRESSKRFAGQARFASLPRSLNSLSSSKVDSSDSDQTCLGGTDVVNPISLVFEDLNEYLSDSDGMLSLDYKIAVQKRRNKLRNLAAKQSKVGNVIQDQSLLSHGTKTVENFADNETRMGPSQQPIADNPNNSPSRVKKVVEQIQRKYPQGSSKPVERSRSRRSPSVASECSTLEPIPEEIPGQVYAARVTKPLSIPSPKFYSLPRGGKAFQSNLDNVKENVADKSHSAIFDTFIQSKRTASPSRLIEIPNGTLKQRKALKTASLTSLLIKDDNESSNREPPTFASSFRENPLAKCSSFQELSNIFGSTQSLAPLTPRRLDPMAKNLQTKKWVSEVNLGMRAWTPNQIVIKECSCGNKVQFDPMEECSTLGYPTDSETNLELSDYGSFDRRNNGLFYAKPAETINGSDDDDDSHPDNLTPPPPPRPPPPTLLFNRLGSLKRSQSLNMSYPQRHLNGWNSIQTLSQS